MHRIDFRGSEVTQKFLQIVSRSVAVYPWTGNIGNMCFLSPNFGEEHFRWTELKQKLHVQHLQRAHRRVTRSRHVRKKDYFFQNSIVRVASRFGVNFPVCRKKFFNLRISSGYGLDFGVPSSKLQNSLLKKDMNLKPVSMESPGCVESS